MPPDEAPLTELASSVADGAAIDWLAAESTAATPEEQTLLQQLRIIANLAGAHRQAADAVFDSPAVRVIVPGTTWGPFTIRRTLGEGAFGTVYVAWEEGVEREVALKLLRDTTASESVKKEASLIASVRHANVVVVHGVAEIDGMVGLWMDLVDGLTIKDLLAARGAMSSRETLMMGIDLCGALAAVHNAGLLHRDIKAQNVMRETGGRIVLMDFGGGERKSDGDGARTRVVTPLYVAPEVLNGGAATIASDIYSLGVLLYHAVTTRYPIEGSTLEEVEAAHASAAVPLLDRRPDITSRFARVVERAIDPDPSRRYRTAGEFQQDVRAALDAELTQPATNAHTSQQALRKSLPSVAVLPFLNTDGGEELDYFCTGLAEDLVIGLNTVAGLRVASTMSSFAPQHADNLDLKAVCRQLNVDAVLCGTVRRRREQLRITAELVSAADGCQIWSDGSTHRFEDLEDLYVVQEKIARSVVDVMKVKVGDLARRPLIRRDTQNRRARDWYMRGRHHWGKRYQGGLVSALQEFGKAIAEDQGYALAYAGLADAFAFLGFYSLDQPRGAFKQARAAAEQALRLDPDLPEAHTSLALVKLGDEWNFDEAEREFSHALAIDEKQVLTRIYLSWLLVLIGDTNKAILEARRAQEEEPHAPLVNSGAGHTFFLLGRDEEAIDYCQKALDFDHDCLVAIYVMGASRARQGRLNEAIVLLERAADISARASNAGRAPFFLAILGNFYARVGAADKVAAIFAELDQIKAQGRYVPPHSQAFIYAGMQDLDRAFEWQGKACADGASPFNYFSPVIANMHADPRHDAEKKRMGFRL